MPHARDGDGGRRQDRADAHHRPRARGAGRRAHGAEFRRPSLRHRHRDRRLRAQVAGTKTRIICTRKTTPGLRALEKYAVRCGGGFNHRFGLDDAILIKDNHIAVAGGIRAVLERARPIAGHLVKIEIEVDSLEQLHEVLDIGLADVVLLDNFDVPTLKQAVAMVGGRLVIEASGGITLDNVARDRGDRRRLRLLRRAHAFGAQPGHRPRYRDVMCPAWIVHASFGQSSCRREWPIAIRCAWICICWRRSAISSRSGGLPGAPDGPRIATADGLITIEIASPRWPRFAARLAVGAYASGGCPDRPLTSSRSPQAGSVGAVAPARRTVEDVDAERCAWSWCAPTTG